MTTHNHSDLGEWYKAIQNTLRDNEKLLLKYALVSGVRKNEAIKSFNLIIDLAKEAKLDTYYNSDIGILEHYKQKYPNGKVYVSHSN